MFHEIKRFNTPYGKIRMIMKLLEIAYKGNMEGYLINLYLQVLSDTYANKHEEKLIKRVTKIMTSIDYKKIQFE